MVKTRFLLVGQGLAGTFLSRDLLRAGEPLIVIDDGRKNSASRVAAGIINPVTGRRIVRTWMIETLLPFAVESYRDIGSELGIDTITEKPMIDFFPSPQMRDAFVKRIAEEETFLRWPADPNAFDDSFRSEFGCGEIFPCYTVALDRLLPAWRRKLNDHNMLVADYFEPNDLRIYSGYVEYRDIRAEKIIFCDGIASSENRLFGKLPFALNKGEALIIRCPGIHSANLYKKGALLAPLGDDIFWAGSSYEWEFSDTGPSEAFRKRTTAQLAQWLKSDFTVEDHLAAVRPATLERRPFAGIHPHFPAVGILNGMGTKGCSLAPWFSRQLSSHLTKNTPILPEANVDRFRRILDPENQKNTGRANQL